MGFLVNLFVSLMGSVWNVSQVKMNKDVVFPTTDDHSKWGVSDDQSNWICVGDINRAVIFLQNTFFVTIDSRIWMHSFLNSNTRSSAAAAPCARAHKSSLNATENWSARISHAVNSSKKTPTIEFWYIFRITIGINDRVWENTDSSIFYYCWLMNVVCLFSCILTKIASIYQTKWRWCVWISFFSQCNASRMFFVQLMHNCATSVEITWPNSIKPNSMLHSLFCCFIHSKKQFKFNSKYIS